MEFLEFLTVVVVVLMLPSVIFFNIRRMVEAKHRSRQGASDGLRMSELQAMIELAVEDATEPLQRRIEQLEAMQDAGLLEVPRLSLDLDAEALGDEAMRTPVQMRA